MKSEEVYEKLRAFLDQFPIGFPKTSSGVELKILKKLFTEEEANLAIYLTIQPKEASRIAKKARLNEKHVEEKLLNMSQRGLVFRVYRKGKTLYNSAPFMIGIYEYSVNKLDKELAELYTEYYNTRYLDEIGASNVPGFKVIPVEETIPIDTVLLPYQKLKESIKNSRKISVADCICRKEAKLIGHECRYPIEDMCLSFGVAAEFYIENGVGREITPEEAIEIIEKADMLGLVHAGANSKHLSNICNCCRCCCVSMKGITLLGHEKHRYMNALFESIIDFEKCIACRNCIDRCPVGAIEVKDTAIVDRDRCLGCGLCASICPENAISLQIREDIEEPYNRVLELGQAIIESKKNK